MGYYPAMDRIEIDYSNPEHWIFVARKWARSVCRDKPWWDVDDLEGYILLGMVRWPAKNTQGLWQRARASTTDWHRERLGRKGQKSEVANPLSLHHQKEMGGVGDSYTVEFGDLIPDNADVEGEAIAEILAEWLPSLFEERDAKMLRMLIDGYRMAEIAAEFSVTESRVSQIFTNRIKPKIASMLNLEGMRKTTYA